MKKKLRVLVVDDDPLVRLSIDRQLEALSYDPVTVNNGREAIRVVEMGLVIDILLTDLDLPDSHGVSIAAAIAGLSPATRVAFMSGMAPSDPLEPRDAPFLLKPFSMTALANAMSGAISYPR